MSIDALKQQRIDLSFSASESMMLRGQNVQNVGRKKVRPNFHGLPGKNLKKELIPIILYGEAGGDSLFLRFFSPISIPRYSIVLRINNFQTR